MSLSSHWQQRFRAIVSVYLILLDEQDRVLQLKRQNTGYCDGQYGLPAGHVDGNETCLAAMVREAKEEIGINLDEKNLTLEHTMHRCCGDHERIDLFFSCRTWNGTPTNAEPEKCSELRWSDINNLPNETIDYYKQMFLCVRQDKTYSEFGW